jgi:hypothetical protein
MKMPFGSKYGNEANPTSKHMMHDRQRVAGMYATKAPQDTQKAMKATKDYDQVKNMVIEGEGQAMHNVSQVVSNLKNPLHKAEGKKRK